MSGLKPGDALATLNHLRALRDLSDLARDGASRAPANIAMLREVLNDIHLKLETIIREAL